MAKFRDTVISAVELTSNIAFDGAHTPWACFVRAVTIFLVLRAGIGSCKKKKCNARVGRGEKGFSQNYPPNAEAKDEQ